MDYGKSLPFSEQGLRDLISPYLDFPFVFLETAAFNSKNTCSFLFTDFSYIITFWYDDDVEVFFNKVEDLLKSGFWLCGYFSYEFGFFLEPALYPLREKFNFPLAWLGACRRPLVIDHKTSREDFSKSAPVESSYAINNLVPNITQQD
jgi:anthranilate/para-aminobenzoate synthase component I